MLHDCRVIKQLTQAAVACPAVEQVLPSDGCGVHVQRRRGISAPYPTAAVSRTRVAKRRRRMYAASVLPLRGSVPAVLAFRAAVISSIPAQGFFNWTRMAPTFSHPQCFNLNVWQFFPRSRKLLTDNWNGFFRALLVRFFFPALHQLILIIAWLIAFK